MEKEKIYAERKELMERLVDSFQDNLIPAMIREPENPEDPEEPVVMSVLFDEMGRGEDEAFGEFCFRPLISEEDEVQFFTALITFSDTLEERFVPALFEAASYINFKIPGGSFMVDYTHTFLCFRLSVPMPIALSGDALFEEMNIAAANAVTIADAYYDLLLDVSRGEAAVEDVVEFLGGSVEK